MDGQQQPQDGGAPKITLRLKLPTPAQAPVVQAPSPQPQHVKF